MDPFQPLPLEMLYEIALKSPPHDLWNLCQTSRRFYYDLGHNENVGIWKDIYQREISSVPQSNWTEETYRRAYFEIMKKLHAPGVNSVDIAFSCNSNVLLDQLLRSLHPSQLSQHLEDIAYDTYMSGKSNDAMIVFLNFMVSFQPTGEANAVLESLYYLAAKLNNSCILQYFITHLHIYYPFMNNPDISLEISKILFSAHSDFNLRNLYFALHNFDEITFKNLLHSMSPLDDKISIPLYAELYRLSSHTQIQRLLPFVQLLINATDPSDLEEIPHLIQYYLHHTYSSETSTFCQIVLNILKELIQLPREVLEYLIFMDPVRSKDYPELQELLKSGFLPSPDNFIDAIEYGDLELVQYLLNCSQNRNDLPFIIELMQEYASDIPDSPIKAYVMNL